MAFKWYSISYRNGATQIMKAKNRRCLEKRLSTDTLDQVVITPFPNIKRATRPGPSRVQRP